VETGKWPPLARWAKAPQPESQSVSAGKEKEAAETAFLPPIYLTSQLEPSEEDSDWEDRSDWEDDSDCKDDYDLEDSVPKEEEEVVQLDPKYLVNQWGTLDCDPDWEESVIADSWADYEVVQLAPKYLANQLKHRGDAGLGDHSVLDDLRAHDKVG